MDLPPAETIIKKASPSGAQDFNPGEEIDVPENMSWQGWRLSQLSREVRRSRDFYSPISPGSRRIEKVESTVGETLATGELSPPTSGVEKDLLLLKDLSP